ncbi:unnamed protein product [Phytophthora fragariaefolia]|uniref:Unnamed protein product n=1 Tax=Phytophthora fragariaefolia TaxID=1490495 RepID=A0A9W6XIA3_9STRA|nr:unnamed protein product [Phytophthora fragariaefolia]
MANSKARAVYAVQKGEEPTRARAFLLSQWTQEIACTVWIELLLPSSRVIAVVLDLETMHNSDERAFYREKLSSVYGFMTPNAKIEDEMIDDHVVLSAGDLVDMILKATCNLAYKVPNMQPGQALTARLVMRKHAFFNIQIMYPLVLPCWPSNLVEALLAAVGHIGGICDLETVEEREAWTWQWYLGEITRHPLHSLRSLVSPPASLSCSSRSIQPRLLVLALEDILAWMADEFAVSSIP